MSKIKREIVIEVLKSIQERDGVIDPAVLVKEAEDESHPLHAAFNWDDTKAAFEWRKQQARNLIKYSYESTDPEKVASRHFNVTYQNKRGYVSEDRVREVGSLYDQVLKDAVTGLLAWQDRYNYIKELKPVIDETALNKLRQFVGV